MPALRAPLAHLSLLVLSWLVTPSHAPADDRQLARGNDQLFEIPCGGTTIVFDIHAWRPPGDDWVPTADDSAGGLLLVSAIEMQPDGPEIPFRRKVLVADGLLFQWSTATSGADVYSVTIPWRDLMKQELGEPVACERTVADSGSSSIEEETNPREIFLPYDEPPKAIKIFTPEYPAQARDARTEGMVSVLMTIGESGRVIAASVHRSDTNAALEEAALEAALLSIFRPAMADGVPIQSRIIFPFRFKAN
jgi:TonB family protein